MNNRKNTRRALFASVISMLLCVTMLVGSTFAWFTDNASTAVSNIVSGTLDIELLNGNTENAESLEGKTLTFAKAAGGAGETVLFEPGAKYSLQQVWLHNAGNLHAKYQVVITGIDGSSLLAQVLDVYVAGTNVGTLASLITNGGIVKEGTIAPKAFDTFGAIELEMRTTAGNEYQNLTMDGIAITVQATQATVEHDSEDNLYDAGATFDKLVVAANQDELNDALSNIPNGEPVTVSLPEGNFKLPTIGSAQVPTPKEITITGSKDTVIDMTTAVQTANCVLTFDGVTVDYHDTNNYIGFQHAAKVVYKDCTITGQITNYAPEATFINCTFENKTGYNIWTYGGTNVTFTNCTFQTGGRAILVYNEQTSSNFVADIVVTNCTFSDDGTYTGAKAVVETGSNASNTETSNKYNLTFKDCTVTGFEQNNSTSKLWGNKNSMDTDHLNVVIDGVDVY